MSETVQIPADQIAIDTVQSRKEVWKGDELDQALIDSISGIGLIHDIVVRKTTTGKYGGETDKPFALVAGSRRFNALIQAGVYQIPCKILDLSDVEAAGLSLSENLGRKDLSEHQKMLAITTWINLIKITGKSHTDAVDVVAKRVYGGKRSHVYSILLASNLPKDLQILMKRSDERTDEEKQFLVDHGIRSRFKLGYSELAQISKIFEVLEGGSESDKVKKVYSMIDALRIDIAPQDSVRRTLMDVRKRLEEGASFDMVIKDIQGDREIFSISSLKTVSFVIPLDYESYHRSACSRAGKTGPDLVMEVYINWLKDQSRRWQAT